jgi:hypothetical protein
VQERGNGVPLRAFMIASRPEVLGKPFRVQHLFLGSLNDAMSAADDRLQVVVGIIDTMPGARITDVRISADAMLLLTRCTCDC